MKQNEWKKIGKLQKKRSKTFHWTKYTEVGFMKRNEWKKIGKLEKKGSKTLQ
jgi:hypothetical protein